MKRAPPIDFQFKKNILQSATLCSVLSVLFFLPFIHAQADWTRVYCNYTFGSGAGICDTGQVPGDTASCTPISKATHCAGEGQVWCWAETQSAPIGYESVNNPVYNIAWDTDPADCQCKTNASYTYNTGQISFESGLFANCCGDDPGETYAGPENGKSCSGIARWCCNDPRDIVLNGQCTQLDGGCPVITRAYWANMAGQEITSAQVDDYVQLVADTQYVNGLGVKYTLWEDDPSQCYQEVHTINASNNRSVYLWKIKACSGGSTDGNLFSAQVAINPSSIQYAPKLIVDPVPNNSNPIALVDTPRNGQIYNITDTVRFNSSSVDEDDPIIYAWAFGDGTSSPEQNTSHNYNYGGPKMPSLTVTDARGAASSAQVSILIDSPLDDAPLAVISAPKIDAQFFGLLITLDARNSTDDRKWDRSPSCVSSSGRCWQNLTFTWQFDEGPVYQAQGTAGAYFTRLFSKAGPHTAHLTLDDADPTAETETRFSIEGCSIKVNSNYEYVSFGSCSIESRHYFCVNATTYYDTFQSGCHGADNASGTYDDCCPRGFYCPSINAACKERTEACSNFTVQAQCQSVGCFWMSGICLDPDNFNSCSDYTSQAACQADVLGLGKAGGKGLGTEICGKSFSGGSGGYVVPRESCKCEWGAGNPQCKFSYYSNNSIGGNGSSFIKCQKTYGLGNCSATGTQQLAWTASIVSGPNNTDSQNQCSSGSKSIKCGLPVTQLPFFTLPNVLAVITLLIAYYFLTMKAPQRKKTVQKSSRKKKKEHL